MKSKIALLVVMSGVLMGCAARSGEVRTTAAPVWRQAPLVCRAARDVLVCARDPAEPSREACKCMDVNELARSHNLSMP